MFSGDTRYRGDYGIIHTTAAAVQGSDLRRQRELQQQVPGLGHVRYARRTGQTYCAGGGFTGDLCGWTVIGTQEDIDLAPADEPPFVLRNIVVGVRDDDRRCCRRLGRPGLHQALRQHGDRGRYQQRDVRAVRRLRRHIFTDIHDVYESTPIDTLLLSANKQRLHTIYGDTHGWHAIDVVDVLAFSPFSAVKRAMPYPDVMANENGILHQIVYNGAQGWSNLSTGLNIGVENKLSAVKMDSNGWPEVFATENCQSGSCQLHFIYGDTLGWHDTNTGLAVSDRISAVNMGGSSPQVMVVKNGTLQQVTRNGSTWQIGNTGISIPSGVGISAVNMGGGWPQVMTIKMPSCTRSSATPPAGTTSTPG